MTNTYINSSYSLLGNVLGIKSIYFDHLGKKVFSANIVEKIYSTFVSQIIVAPVNFLEWDSYNLITNSMDNIWVYFRSSNSNINQAPWIGPFKNTKQDLVNINKNLFQFMVIMVDDGTMLTQLNSIQLNYISRENISKFYSKTFNLGFKPEHLILTYNSDKIDNSILRFAIAGENTLDSSKYQYIEPNKIQELYNIPTYSDKIKLMMELAGTSGIPLKIHEVSMMFSGTKNEKINKTAIKSSSSDSTESSLSSSIDSSSSDSTLSTSSSSSLGESSTSSSSSRGSSSSSSLITSSSSSSLITSSSSSLITSSSSSLITSSSSSSLITSSSSSSLITSSSSSSLITSSSSSKDSSSSSSSKGFSDSSSLDIFLTVYDSGDPNLDGNYYWDNNTFSYSWYGSPRKVFYKAGDINKRIEVGIFSIWELNDNNNLIGYWYNINDPFSDETYPSGVTPYSYVSGRENTAIIVNNT